jgi:aldehyde dehydrogenase (NAD+)
MQIYGNYINGNFQKGRPNFSKIDPSTGKDIGFFTLSRKAEIDEAVEAAKLAYPSWRAKSRVLRAELFDNLAQIIKKRKDEIAHTISLETGKSLNESMAEVIESLHMVQYTFGKGREPFGDVVSSEIADRDCVILKRPKGVVAVIAPWNFPFAIAGAWTTAPALLEGNTVVLKPSEDSPLTGNMIAQLYAEAGFPAGTFNLIQGDGEVGRYLSAHDDVDHICFTGSFDVAKKIRQVCANSKHRTCSCETGSKSAVIVFDDCDIDLAAEAAVNSAFKLSGQRCVSSGRILVQRSIFQLFQEKFLTLAKSVKTVSPFANDNGLTMGPLINQSQKERVNHFNNLVRSDKEAVVLWDQDGIHGEMNIAGYFLRPFVYKTEWRDATYLKQEVFGPHVALIPFDEMEDAIRIYNDTDFGLALGVVTNDFRKMKIIRERCDAGMIYFNLGSIGAESHTNFGGIKSSGYGGASAGATFDTVTHKITVSTNHARALNFPQGMRS